MGSASKMMQDEAGASDNRLSWTPSEFPETEDWEDGKEYTVTLRIRQTAPGEGQILTLASAGGPPKESPNDTEGVTGEDEGGGGAAEYENPAIARLMASKKA